VGAGGGWGGFGDGEIWYEVRNRLLQAHCINRWADSRGLLAGGPERWAGLLAEPEELIAIRALQRGTFTGRPVGEPDFVARLEEQLGRPLAPRQGQRAPYSLGAA
jgi:hypothetical protein